MKKKLRELESQLFCLECKDHWSPSDYDLHDKLTKEIKKLKKEGK